MLVTRHPLQLFLILLIFIFFGEIGVMLLLDGIESLHRSILLEAITDAAVLTTLCAPFFWLFLLKPLQRALQLESVKSHKIVEMAADGIISIDTRGTIQSFNRAAQRMFGYSEAEVVGRNVSLLMPPPHRDSHDDYLARYLQTGQGNVIGKTRELDGMRKDGTIFPMELGVSEIILDDEHLFTAMLRDISEQKLAQERIRQMAHYDDLTQLPNRSLFFDRLRQAVLLTKRNKRGIALFYMDLDGFKQVNDTLGHHIGDLLLVRVAERLRQCVRESDTLARLGGDEFMLILNDINERGDMSMVAGKIVDSIAVPFDLEGHAVHIGVSVGIACYPEDSAVESELLVTADKAMYAAKAAGRNTYRFGSVPDEAP
ncbi:MAG: diguanylate cyclase [Gallionella sp.]|nr:diguanylate cyclase [Gallionella sp.]